METQTEDRIRTRKEVADRIRVSVRTLTRMEAKGELPPRIKITDQIFGYRDSEKISSSPRASRAGSGAKMTEAQLQKALVGHIKARGVPGLVWWHSPNGARLAGRRGAAVTGAQLKALGMRPGVSDLILVHDGQPFALELKVDKGRVSESQEQFLSDFENAGGKSSIAYGLDEAIAALERWKLLKGTTSASTH